MFWIRELAGWGLVLFALYLIRIGLVFIMDLENPRIVESAVASITGIGVLRAGVWLIRVSTAARLCRFDQN